VTNGGTVDDAPHGAEDGPDGEFKVPNAPEKGWTHVVSTAGFQGDHTIHAQNASPQPSNFAEWEIRATSANPELFATWVALPGNATNATYQVFAESSDGGNDDKPLLTVVVDQTRGPSDALLFGTTLAQSLGSVKLPNWKPGTMLSVRLLTQGANGNVVADAVFDPPARAVIRPDSVPPARLRLEAQDATALLPSPPAVLGSRVANATGTTRREAVVDAVFLLALSGGLEAAVPLTFKDSLFVQLAPELSSPGKVSVVDDFGNVNAGSPGKVHLSSTDATQGPQDFTFSNNDSSVHVFGYTFKTLGLQTLSIVDTTDNAILGSAVVNVLPK
jgi:hypothetical protein